MTQEARKPEKSLFIYKKENLKKIKHLKLIDNLKINKKESVIIGSSVLVLCNIIEKNNDIDLVVTNRVFQEIKRNSEFIKIYKQEYNKVFYQTKNGELELAANCQVLNKTAQQLINRSIVVEDYQFMSLRDTYTMYKLLNRSKDQYKIKQIEKVLSITI